MAASAPVASVCKSDCAVKTESVEWHVGHWSSLSSCHSSSGAEGRTSSKEMQACGEPWEIHVHRGGLHLPTDSEDEVANFKKGVAIFLVYTGGSEGLRTRFSLTLVNQLPGEEDFQRFYECTFGKGDGGKRDWGSKRFIKRSVLEDETKGLKLDDRVIIRATVTTYGKLESTVTAHTPAFAPPNTLSRDLEAMLTAGDASDIALYVGPREFNAHKFVLRARSPYFKGLFSSSMRDSDSDGLTITDTEPDVFEQLLRWMYAGELVDSALETADMAEHCLMGANRYELEGLKLLCEAKLCEGLTVEVTD